jgi:F-type H+-transporting ATPase subunit beta
MNEPRSFRARVALSGLTIAEGFCDGRRAPVPAATSVLHRQHFRFTQAGSKYGSGRMPRPWAPAHAGHRMGAM